MGRISNYDNKTRTNVSEHATSKQIKQESLRFYSFLNLPEQPGLSSSIGLPEQPGLSSSICLEAMML